MESTAFNQAGWNPLHLIGMHFTTLHGIYCIQSRCMEFTAFNWDQLHNDASNPLRSIKIHWTTLHGMHCILSRSIGPRCMESTAFNWDPLWRNGSLLYAVESMQRGPMHLDWMQWILCSIQSCCMESTAFNRDAFYHAAWITLHSITMHGIHAEW